MIILPVHNLVTLPEASYTFQPDFFREMAKAEADIDDTVVFLIMKEDKKREALTEDDFYPIGLVGVVTITGNIIEIRAERRIEIDTITKEDDRFSVTYSVLNDIVDMNDEERKSAFVRVRDALLTSIKNYPWGMMVRNAISEWHCLEDMLVNMSPHLASTPAERYAMLEKDRLSERYQLMEDAVYEVAEFLKLGTELTQTVDEAHQKQYREHALRRQLNVIQGELDKLHPSDKSELDLLEEKIEASGMNETALKEARKVLKRMKQEGEEGHEYGMLYDYLDFVTSLSWKKEEYKEISIEKAAKILDEEHYGMKKPKERILEHLAVMALNKKQSGSILLFVGAPGTGKTSIGQSIAKALDRPYVRISLGGVRDEAEIRGHRRTYVGALPGRIMDGIKRSGASNPVVVLDEVDKMASSFDGDPASALLEVLDPEQNSNFTDHYMNVPYDLSDVLFICTANDAGEIPEPLWDRMEYIPFKGYTETEKVQIAKRHLIPQSLEKTGLKKSDLRISDKALSRIISDYTMESGVRALKKRVDTLCRRTALQYVKGDRKPVSVTVKNLKDYMEGKPILHDKARNSKIPGIVTGLAYTPYGGDIMFLEAVMTRGRGGLHLTGQLGSVMRESAEIAITLVKAMQPKCSILFETSDIHIHAPEGAIRKEGPSAGITMVTVLASMVTKKPVPGDVAMTGEISLRGEVMPIGGLTEKLMAAGRAGVKKVFIPKDNVRDLEDIPEEIKGKLEIVPVKYVTDVLKALDLMIPDDVIDLWIPKKPEEEEKDKDKENETEEGKESKTSEDSKTAKDSKAAKDSESKDSESKSSEDKASEDQASEDKVSEDKATEDQASEGKVSED